jgi:adhesin transport system membrane fusion protein
MTLQVVTEGGVVQPGGTLMTLVPANEPLLVEARLPVGDIGVVRVGQEARIQRLLRGAGFQPINGKVVLISPDSMLDDQKIPTTVSVSPQPKWRSRIVARAIR